MSLRTKLNESPAISVGIVIALLGTAAGAGWYALKPSEYHRPTKAFYTVDEGKTLFVDDVDRLTPFQYGGQDAVLAHVYTCDGGKTQFVAYLERMPQGAQAVVPVAETPAAPKPIPKTEAEYRAMRDAELRAAPSAAKGAAGKPGTFNAWVRKPGEAEWLKPGNPKYFPLISVKCPSGGQLDRVDP